MTTQTVALARAEVLETGSADLGTWPKVRLIFESAKGDRFEVIELACKLIPVGSIKPKPKMGSAWRDEGGLNLVGNLRREGGI